MASLLALQCPNNDEREKKRERNQDTYLHWVAGSSDIILMMDP